MEALLGESISPRLSGEEKGEIPARWRGAGWAKKNLAGQGNLAPDGVVASRTEEISVEELHKRLVAP